MYTASLLSRSTPTTSSQSKSHSVATFAGAVGGSVGLLSFLALSLAISLYRRRQRARRRDRAHREARRDAASISSFHTDASEDGPPMQGPAPFVPRYFPGTVIMTAPPPYSPPAPPSNSPTSALLGPPETPVPSMSFYSRRFDIPADGDTSYADRPPPTPPLGYGIDLEDGYFAPPPSFPVAISTPVPAILAGLSTVVSTSQPPSSRSSSPVVPLLAPPPSSRPINASAAGEAPVAGPSGSHGQPSSTVPSSRSSVQVLHVSNTSSHGHSSTLSLQQPRHNSSRPASMLSTTLQLAGFGDEQGSHDASSTSEDDRTSIRP